MEKIFTILGLFSAIALTNAQIVINEIYGGGGNSGATLKNDFIELKNIGSTTVSLSGATIQYAAATATFTQYHNLPGITLTPGQTYLIQEATGGGGTVNLPTPDFIATTVINFNGTPNPSIGIGIAVTSGKVVLASDNTQVTSPASSNVLDFVGYGTADQYEGAGAAPSPTTTTSITRMSGDTNNNVVDFSIVTASPTNSSGASLAVSDLDVVSDPLFIQNTFVKDNEIVFGTVVKNVKVYDMFGQVVKKAGVKSIFNLDVSDLKKGNYIVTGTINNEPVSQKILKD
ncbi:lamin tail domain-containing protein [Chryseobacterium populi]|uniref:Por secretion system C-terminal sorting domain containing protein n=1 Tax=Chryseobacterium populi TaxID=1144316 RepID=J3CIZ1_9FLAO|nr:lamin tail domain-containing protein [Chryseobacterium populi]EJL72411.1 Por secretion system C-terminal sorting domain containing protein [Chryseobacterium populi]